jgi:hypothetical protein
VKKVYDEMKKIDQQVSDRDNRTVGKAIFQGTLNRARMEDAIENNKHCKYQLDCIKERVKRKYVKTTRRRAIQLEQLAPPSTFEIYMQN